MLIPKGDNLGHTAAAGYELGVSALGAVVWYLQHCLLDQELLSLRTFELYTPIDVAAASTENRSPEMNSTFSGGRAHMVSQSLHDV